MMLARAAQAEAARHREGAHRGASTSRAPASREASIAGPGVHQLSHRRRRRSRAALAAILDEGDALRPLERRAGQAGERRVRLREPDRAAARRPRPPGRARRRDLARCSTHAGWKVTREFYYNDGGVQIDEPRAERAGAHRASSPAQTRRDSRGRLSRRVHRARSPRAIVDEHAGRRRRGDDLDARAPRSRCGAARASRTSTCRRSA